jgi:hypothetical protein
MQASEERDQALRFAEGNTHIQMQGKYGTQIPTRQSPSRRYQAIVDALTGRATERNLRQISQRGSPDWGTSPMPHKREEG